jgi:cation/acetate symporter
MAPHLRAMGCTPCRTSSAVRFGGRWPRLIAALAAVLCSFTYVVAQIYGVGLIASRLTGVQFEIGILLGLGGVLLCSFLGGMRAITWTQVAQYVVLLLAFLIPVSWLAYKQLGNPLAPLVYGSSCDKIAELEKADRSPAEQEVRGAICERARDYESACSDMAMPRWRASAQRAGGNMRALKAPECRFWPDDGASASWPRCPRRSQPRASCGRAPCTRAWSVPSRWAACRPQPGLCGRPRRHAGRAAPSSDSRLNFLALMFCLMVGTAGLPHLLTRFYTTPTVAEARSSVAWSLFFIALLYLSAPALAVLVKFEVMQHLVGSSFDALPNWIAQWAKVDPCADVGGMSMATASCSSAKSAWAPT